MDKLLLSLLTAVDPWGMQDLGWRGCPMAFASFGPGAL